MDFSFSDLNFNSIETLPGFEARAAFTVNSSSVFKEDVDMVPQGWHELSDKQLRFVYQLLADNFATDISLEQAFNTYIQEFYADSLGQEFCRAISKSLNPDIMRRFVTK